MSTSSDMPGSSRNNHIEILRAFAVTAVVVLHLQMIPYYFSGGEFLSLYAHLGLQVGVDLFLVISGFVITSSLLRSRSNVDAPRKTVVLSFWVRRIFRLLPSAWFWLFIVLLYRFGAYFWGGSWGELWRDLLSIAAALLNVMNIYGAYCPINSAGDLCAPNVVAHGHYWSLSLEEQFYLIFPLLFFFVNRKVFVVLLIAAIALQLFWTRPLFTLFYFLKTDALCWGVLLALLVDTPVYQKLKNFFCKHNYLSTVIVVTTLIALPIVTSDVQGVFTMRSYGVSLVAIMSAVLVLFASFEFLQIDRNNPVYGLLLYLGSRSYAIYVIHLIIFIIIGGFRTGYDLGIESTAMQLAYDWFLCIVATAITLALSEWNYRVIELPWRQKGREISARMLAVPKQSESG